MTRLKKILEQFVLYISIVRLERKENFNQVSPEHVLSILKKLGDIYPGLSPLTGRLSFSAVTPIRSFGFRYSCEETLQTIWSLSLERYLSDDIKDDDAKRLSWLRVMATCNHYFQQLNDKFETSENHYVKAA